MKTIALMSLVILTGLLLVPTSQAAPSCCDPNQAQGRPGMFPSAPGVGGAFPVAPKSPYVQPVPSNYAGHGSWTSEYTDISAVRPPYYRGPVIPVQAISVNPPVAPVAAAPGPCACGGRFEAAAPAPSGNCCSGRGLNVPRQVVIPSESAPSCCAGRVNPAAPVSSCCAGKVKAAAPARARQVKAAAPVPNCCAVGPKTAGSVPQFTKGARNAPYSYLPLHAQPAAIPAGFQSNMASAMQVPSSGAPALRFGSLW